MSKNSSQNSLAYVLLTTILIPFFVMGASPDKHKDLPSKIAFVNVNVIPMENEQLLEGRTVVVNNGLIETVGPASSVQIPVDATKIDGTGKYLMPGLADMHVHNWSESEFVLFLANGVTTIRNMWGAPQHLQWRSKIEKGELLGPTIYTAGPLLDGDPPIWEGSTVVTTPEEAERAVTEQKEAGYDFIKIYNHLSLEVFDAIMAAAKKHEIPVAGHVPDAVGLDHFLNMGVLCNEHLTGYREMLETEDSPVRGKNDLPSRIKRWNHIDDSKIPEVVDATVSAGLWNCSTIVVYQTYVSPAEANELYNLPEMKYVDPLTKASWDPSQDFRSKDLTADDFVLIKKGTALMVKLTGALHNAGAKLVLGTDTPNPFVIPGFSIHRELTNLVDAGLSPYEAIRAGTSSAAEFFGVDTFGTIAEGKRADLLLLKENPLQDVANITKREGVMVRGRWLPEQELQKQLENLAASYVSQKKRFADVPVLPSEGESEFLGRYEMKYNKVVLGEERFSINSLPNGRLSVFSQAVTDPPYKSLATMRLEFDDKGKCYSLFYENESSTGKDSIQMTFSEDELKVTGTLASGEEINIEEEVIEDFLLGASMTGSTIPVVQLITSLEVAEIRELKSKTMQMMPAFFISDESIKVTREPDDVRQSPQGMVPVRVYSVDVQSKTLPYQQIIVLDQDNRLLELEIKSQMGSFKFVRIQ
jgi:imidazolonepropionase-like amidohydrolase